MARSIKTVEAILKKLKIAKLNAMQEEMSLAISSSSEVILLSPTGSGKTLAFLLPLISLVEINRKEIQVAIVVPSRELAIQILQVLHNMGTGLKANAVYGGTSFSKDKIDLKHAPHILIGTPGRMADHIRRGTIDTDYVSYLVLDEFDKSLEIGFEDEMSEILENLELLEKKILTSATNETAIPDFVRLRSPLTINYLKDGVDSLEIKSIISPSKDKLETLAKAIKHFGNQPGIIFSNYKDSIQRISDYLIQNGIDHGCFYGGLEQKDRERALVKFRNGTHQIIIATDLAARGLDIPEIKYIIHYHLPHRSQEFTHRNGRTARMHNDGTAYVLQWKGEELPDFITTLNLEEHNIETENPILPSKWLTVEINGGRREKISKGDIVGLFCKQGGLNQNHIGMIELKPDCAFIAVARSKAKSLVRNIDNTRLKKKKIRAEII